MIEVKRKLDGYFFGGTPPLSDAIWFYGFLAFCTIIALAMGTVNVLNWGV